MDPQTNQRARVHIDQERDYPHKTQPELELPGPPDWPRLPRAVGLAMKEPNERTVLELEQSPTFARVLSIRGMVSSVLKDVGLDVLGNKIAQKNFIGVEGPISVAPRGSVTLTWTTGGGDERRFVCRAPRGLRLAEGEEGVFRLIKDEIERVRDIDDLEDVIDGRKVAEWEHLRP